MTKKKQKGGSMWDSLTATVSNFKTTMTDKFKKTPPTDIETPPADIETPPADIETPNEDTVPPEDATTNATNAGGSRKSTRTVRFSKKNKIYKYNVSRKHKTRRGTRRGGKGITRRGGKGITRRGGKRESKRK